MDNKTHQASKFDIINALSATGKTVVFAFSTEDLIHVRCAIGHAFQRSAERILRGDCDCPYCVGHAKPQESPSEICDILDILFDHGKSPMLDISDIKAETIAIKCESDHIYIRTFAEITDRKISCQECWLRSEDTKNGGTSQEIPQETKEEKRNRERSEILRALLECDKFPLWKMSDDDNVYMRCNWDHIYSRTLAEIRDKKIRCPQCKANIAETAENIYSLDVKEGGINRDLFKIVRINVFGQLVVRCIASNHKIRLKHSKKQDNDTLEYCPECVASDTCPNSNEVLRTRTVAEALAYLRDPIFDSPEPESELSEPRWPSDQESDQEFPESDQEQNINIREIVAEVIREQPSAYLRGKEKARSQQN